MRYQAYVWSGARVGGVGGGGGRVVQHYCYGGYVGGGDGGVTCVSTLKLLTTYRRAMHVLPTDTSPTRTILTLKGVGGCSQPLMINVQSEKRFGTSLETEDSTRLVLFATDIFPSQ
jgi:hypothetical protein